MSRADRTLRPSVAITLLLVAMLGLVSACAKKEPVVVPKPVNKTLVVKAGANANRYNDGAHPIVIRLYQLSGRTEFEAASFWDIFNGTSEALAGVIIDTQSLSPLYPGESRLVAMDLQPDAFYLGAFAEFADYESQVFRSVVPIDAAGLDAGVTISITASGISIRVRTPDTPDPLEAVVEPEPSPSSFPFLGALKKAFGGGGDE